MFDQFGEFLAWFAFIAGTGLAMFIMLDVLWSRER